MFSTSFYRYYSVDLPFIIVIANVVRCNDLHFDTKNKFSIFFQIPNANTHVHKIEIKLTQILLLINQ